MCTQFNTVDTLDWDIFASKIFHIPAEIEVILYTVDDTTFGKRIVCVHNTLDLHD